MSLSYSTEEDVVLLQSILKCRAHLKIDKTGEIHPIKHGIPKAAMVEVAVQYWSALKRPNRFPRRSNKALQHHFCRILYKYGIGELLAESGTEENSALRIRLLGKILRDREGLNDRKRRRHWRNALQSSEGEKSSLSCETARKRLCIATESFESPGDLMDRRDALCLSESSVLGNESEYNTDDGQQPIQRMHAKTEPKVEQEIVEDNTKAVRSTCFDLLVQVIQNGEERRRKLEEHYMHIDNVLLNATEVEAANTKPKAGGRDEVLRMEFMKTLLAKRELELREKELELREKEKMWSLLEKMLS
ncbi:hypothetical protein BWQ96_00009 [Gracilariopsis chorda]|uniref:Uncharacterized protein n=1 Tax=Gracilariopsis chorda TaxID=448386 RepID=A0A2V3J616_9FLOR|nr:hypothetical protein BWQ96_00009 [Gracilariopsis chorda]|eukprot:PXF49849.1 hypothetical protein BWQ96_00009 [Gracilariopsis chorda]